MPPVIRVSIDLAKLQGVKQMLRDNPERFLRVAAGAINDTAKHVASFISKAIRDRVNIRKADIDKHIKRTQATPEKLSATVTLAKSYRLPLKYFGARQTRDGVTYQIDRTTRLVGQSGAMAKALGGNRAKSTRDRISDAFIVDKIGGNVFHRAERNGQTVGRLPIEKLHGPSPWGVFVKAGLRQPTEADANSFLANRIRHRMLYQRSGGSP